MMITRGSVITKQLRRNGRDRDALTTSACNPYNTGKKATIVVTSFYSMPLPQMLCSATSQRPKGSPTTFLAPLVVSLQRLLLRWGPRLWP